MEAIIVLGVVTVSVGFGLALMLAVATRRPRGGAAAPDQSGMPWMYTGDGGGSFDGGDCGSSGDGGGCDGGGD